MHSYFAKFEWNQLIHNKRNWLITVLIIAFFACGHSLFAPDPVNYEVLKKEQLDQVRMQLPVYPENLKEEPDGSIVYENLVNLSSNVGMEYYHASNDGLEHSIEYAERGLISIDYYLDNHQLDNVGLWDSSVIPVDDLMKEQAFLTYLIENEIELNLEATAASSYLTSAVNEFSGLFFLTALLILANMILHYESGHSTVMKGLPFPFLIKVLSKTFSYFFFYTLVILLALVASLLISIQVAGIGNFNYPVVIYLSGEYIAIPTLHYIGIVLIGYLLSTFLILFIAILANMILKNGYATIFFGLGFYMSSQLLLLLDIRFFLFHPLRFLEFPLLLSGDLSQQLSNSYLDYRFGFLAIFLFTLICWFTIYLLNKRSFIRYS